MNLRSIASCLLILAASACPQRPIQGCAVQVSAPGAGGDPAAACAAQRGGKLDPRVRRLPASITGAIASSPERALGPLAQALAQGVDDPFERVKLVHDWIADNIRYDVQGFLAHNPGDNSWSTVPRTGKAVCAKGYAHDPLAAGDRENNHDWNIVTILGERYLVDVTWDSGHIDERNQGVKEYSTEHLFQAPGRFI